MLSECKHIFCGDCFRDFYKSLIMDQMKHDQLKCPEYGCESKPSEEEIRGIIDDTSIF